MQAERCIYSATDETSYIQVRGLQGSQLITAEFHWKVSKIVNGKQNKSWMWQPPAHQWRRQHYHYDEHFSLLGTVDRIEKQPYQLKQKLQKKVLMICVVLQTTAENMSMNKTANNESNITTHVTWSLG